MSIDTAITLSTVKNESRVDSRILAEWLGNKHRTTFRVIRDYQAELEEHGKMCVKNTPSNAGQKERHALLNENQCFFILALSKNTPKVVQLKSAMVKAFGAARRAIADREKYLIDYNAMHASLKLLAEENNTDQKWQHINYNKLINKTFGIKPGARSELDVHTLNLVAGAQALCEDWIARGRGLGMNHKEVYKVIKRHLEAIAESRMLPTPTLQ